MENKERCKDCICLYEDEIIHDEGSGKDKKEKVWFCDEYQKPCSEIVSCEEWPQENQLKTGE